MVDKLPPTHLKLRIIDRHDAAGEKALERVLLVIPIANTLHAN